MIWLGILVLGAIILKRRRKPKLVELLYKKGEIEGDFAVFPCGCRFRWSRNDEKPHLCAAHRAMLDAEVEA